jgi:hypothetical protein
MVLALGRYIRSNTHRLHEQENRAIDLAIAFEVLLIPQDSNDELKFRIVLRAARLLRKRFESRQAVRTCLAELYAARSKAVHTGRISSDIDQTLQESRRYFTELALMLLTMPAIPDWAAVELNDDLAIGRAKE